MKPRLIILALALIAGISFAGARASGNPDKKQARAEKKLDAARKVESLLDSKRYAFVPEKVLSELDRSRYINLTSYYEFDVTPDLIVSLLPYYGKAYSNKYDRPDKLSALDFQSADFTYSKTGRPYGKEKAVIRIQTKNTTNDIQYQMVLEVFDNSSAILTVNSSMATDLVFRGRITEIPDENPYIKSE